LLHDITTSVEPAGSSVKNGTIQSLLIPEFYVFSRILNFGNYTFHKVQCTAVNANIQLGAI
jgi:hypothetical protein